MYYKYPFSPFCAGSRALLQDAGRPPYKRDMLTAPDHGKRAVLAKFSDSKETTHAVQSKNLKLRDAC